MNKKQIEELLSQVSEVFLSIEDDKIGEGYRMATLCLNPIQNFIIELLELEILDQESALMLMTDLVESIEQKDNVLLLDTFKYGIGTLLQDILRIMEEDNE